ncbi:MAG TPA: hypothetical protein VF283_11205 [Bryobacteraceae bacterium]
MASKPGLAPESTPPGEKFTTGAQDVKEKATHAVEAAKQSVSSATRQAAEQVDAKRGSAANAMESAASTIHEKAENLPGGETVRNTAHTAADKLQSTANYVREHDVQSMLSDVEAMVKRNPGPSLLIAAAIGFLIGRAFRGED